VHALDAAQAGINVMLGQVRAANVDGVGTSTLLPCTGTSGKVNGTGDATYSVKIDYYMSDPVTNPTAAKMGCVAGYGTYDPVTDGFTPRFARITATGRDGTSQRGSTRGRTLTATYLFRTTNSNIVGGRIRIYPASSTSAELCMDAGSASPAAGTVIALQPCASPPKDQQVFAYRSDLTIQLLSSISGTNVDGLCLDTQDAPTNGRTIYLAKCQPLGSISTYTQQWSFNDNGGYTAALPTSAATGALSSQCINASSQSAGTQLTLANCSAGNTSSPTQAWIPAPAVGAGAAEAPQLVNYYEFGRCLDVTNQNVNSDHLIDYPCKQNPYPNAVAWNQKFTLPVVTGTNKTGTIYTTTGGTNYCLTSPGTEEGLVVVIPCTAGNARQQWTVYNGNAALPYSAKYQIVDSAGRCLGLRAPVGSEVWSSIDTETCTGATEQKWNATPNLGSAILQDFDEIPTP
jgi:hypothetical protein